jgi:NAD(P)-dependent dehydrogenase (short-subunit alcohol dehydrogenase family)
MNLQLQDKTALVTGSTAGIGEYTAKALAAEGVRVIVHGRNAEAAERVVREIRKNRGEAKSVLGDLASDEQAAQVIKGSQEAFGPVDILVNNAGVFPKRGWWDATPGQWVELYNQNVASMVRLIQGLVPAMKERGWGRVINIASGAGFQPLAEMPDYAATKSVNILMTVSLAKELGNSGVTVNTVSPGPIITPNAQALLLNLGKEQGWGESWEQVEPEAIKNFVSVPLARFGQPEEVAAAIVFLASPLASYIHGANLRVDGGFGVAVN